MIQSIHTSEHLIFTARRKPNMKNLMDYLVEYRNIDFREHPFSAVDALVLCQLSYPKLNGIVPTDGFVSLEHIIFHPDRKTLYTDRVFGEIYREFFENVPFGKRYMKIEAGLFEEYVSIEDECQFAAVTFRIKGDRKTPDICFAAFRGTDEKVIGWKEDFNIGHMDVIPSQKMALDYLNRLGRLPGKARICTGGHSKGGSQAVYAAAKSDSAVKSRIEKIYSFDGIGLGENFYETDDFKSIKDRYIKIVPEQSIIGLLFERTEHCLVVESEKSGFGQHDFMNWHIENGDFKYSSLKRSAERLSAKVNAWADKMEPEEKENLVNVLYRLMLSCDPDDIYNMADNKISKAISICGEFRSLNKDERREFIHALKKIIH